MIRDYKDVSPIERLGLIDMSYSRINSYEMCPAKYFYGYIAKEPQLFSAPAALGNIVHDVLEDHVGEDDILSLAEMVQLFEHHRETRDPEHQINLDLIDAGHEIMAEFVDRHGEEEFDILAKEMAFSVVIGKGHFHGFIDRVDREPDGLRIVDYKTGKYEVAQKDIATNLQLAIYFLACAHLFPEIDTFRTELYYLRSGRRKSHTYTRADIEPMEALVVERLNDIINDYYFHETPNERICSFCEHATSGTCRTGVRRRQKRRPY